RARRCRQDAREEKDEGTEDLVHFGSAPKCDVRFAHNSKARMRRGNLYATAQTCVKNCHLYGQCRYPCENLRMPVWPGVDFVRSRTDTTSPDSRVSGVVGY